jgi:hypothetical protein
MYAKASGNPSMGARLGAMETNVKAMLHRRNPLSRPLFPGARNPELGNSASGRQDECIGTVVFI